MTISPDLTPHDLTSAVDVLVGELLAEAGIDQPPIDALALARSSGVTVVTDRRQQTRARSKRVAGQPVIILRPDDRPERIQWAVAHELGELLAVSALAKSLLDVDDLSPRGREQLANLFATRLLLPTRSFLRDVERLDSDLPLLKERYCTASHELIAWRLLDGERPGIVSIFDQGSLTRRRGNVVARHGDLHPAELQCQQQAHRSGHPATRLCAGRSDQPAISVRAWPVHEPRWKREILYTTFSDSFHSCDAFQID